MGKHLFFVAAPAAGHVNPVLPLVRELVRRGHRVTFACGPAHAGAIEDAGAEAVVLPWTLDPTALSRETFSTTSFVELLDGLLATAAPRLDELVERAAGAELVCFDATVAPVAAAVAQRLGVPAVALIASMAVNEHLPLAELLPPDFRPDNEALVRYATRLHEFSADQGFAQPLVPMAAPPVPLTVVFVPPAFQLATETFDETYRFVGPTVGAGDWEPPSGDRPVLLVSLGTAFTDRPDVFRACAAAFAGTEWHVVMSIGRTDPALLGELPSNVEAFASVPQLGVLRHATAFVSHAGMNSIMEALALEVPLVTLPQVPEQALNARRVRELGLGEVLDSEALTPELVRGTVLRVAGDPAVRDRLAWLAKEITAAGGAAAAADAVLGLLG
ncbi:macrolide family glycosyltransferase [Amycolatopsis rhabdoformis]|uniref:Macrolide family glycosyltransferase n=1 Tax=Amycolatopsis rhabdoformis TaxID=1448059 RepID=A0ABZ1IH03_9PSEU|nr:macrolide family glycosyltransferase [Amycolatopsis rhabdoformis]WSE33750.1 macrolide family glycosyltransferase [Amycolatopsis rhabdoformis]